MRRKDGEEYKKSVVRIMWNSTTMQLQTVICSKFRMKFNRFSDVKLSLVRAAQDAKRRKLLIDPFIKRKLSSSALTSKEL